MQVSWMKIEIKETWQKSKGYKFRKNCVSNITKKIAPVKKKFLLVFQTWLLIIYL